MKLSEVLEQAARRFDEIAARHLIDRETLMRHHGAEPEEIEIELTRLRAQHAEDRRCVLESLVAVARWRQLLEAQPTPWTH